MPTLTKLLTASFVATLASAEQLVYLFWDAKNMPSTGLTDMIFPMAMPDAPHVSGYYFEQAVGFNNLDSKNKNHDIIYTGIQPREDSNGQSIVHATYSTFVYGATSSDSNCHQGADGDSQGVSCAIDFAGTYNTTYEMKIAQQSDNQTYIGTITDTKSGLQRHMGNFTLPSTVNGMNNKYSGFIEYYYSTPGDCSQHPNTAITFGLPRTSTKGVTITQNTIFANSDCNGKLPFSTSRPGPGAYKVVINP